jgi:hypothetical protein
MEQRAAIKLYVKLKKTATDTSITLKSAYGEERVWRTNVSELHKRFKSSSQNENAKIAGENNVNCIC